MRTQLPYCKNRSHKAMTLLETLVASTLGLLVIGSLMALVSTAAKEQRREMVSAYLQQEANLLQDKITRLIRSMSATEAVVAGNPVSNGSAFYNSIIVARGPTPVPREKIFFNSSGPSCMHTPNTALPSVTETFFTSSSLLVLRDMYFFISEKGDGAPDASAITVYFKMDDNGMAFASKTNSVTRSFTATMRNN